MKWSEIVDFVVQGDLNTANAYVVFYDPDGSTVAKENPGMLFEEVIKEVLDDPNVVGSMSLKQKTDSNVGGVQVTQSGGSSATGRFWMDGSGVFHLSRGLNDDQIQLSNDGNVAFCEGDVSVTAGDLDVSDDLTVGKANFRNRTTIDASTYDLLASDYILHVTYTATGACAIDLKTAQVVDGRILIIKDAGGLAGTNNITISTEGGALIDGAATAVINSNYSAINLYCDGTNWFIT